jgi:hypothetical protein
MNFIFRSSKGIGKMKKGRCFPMISLALAAWICVALACTNAIPSKQPPMTATTIAPAATLPPAAPSSRLGEVTEQFGYSLSATKLEYPTNPDAFNAPQQGYKTVSVEILLSNVSGEKPLSVLSFYVTLVDTDGYVYKAAYGNRGDDLDMVDLGIGEKVKGWVDFTIPENATPAYIKYKVDSDIFLLAGLAQ